ncbi:hypothetical protein SDC9_137058 [bioreactor metagenome]|uniref:Uncharacterized protein n=1 Tax=bioreactor metagenome TaxID=1076179 RepID=A0A645DMC8_9ZZZZ
MVVSKLYATESCPSLGSFVLITSTPLDALEPYMAVAAASFSNVIDSTLFISRSYTFSIETWYPSRINVGRFGLVELKVRLSKASVEDVAPVPIAVAPLT